MAFMFATFKDQRITNYVSEEFPEDKAYMDQLEKGGWKIHKFNSWHECEREHARIFTMINGIGPDEPDYDKSQDDFDYEWPDNTFGL